MRVLVVSAHYPPNFISGGTLGPQRVATGLKARGAEVSVYAGWLGDRRALETWTDTGPSGIRVRWIVVTPWIDWSSEGNFDNKDVATDFRLHLEEVRPDVVHVHSLQTLGLGIVRACVEAEIPVVVTMHDFWWICARQFLSNRALQPCSLVVSCGMCPCQVDRRHLDERNTRLRQALLGVDQVLAVSETEADVLRANGIGLDEGGPLLVVDENGLPRLPVTGRPRLEQEPIVFLYTGGSELMKGVHVLFRAASVLGDMPGWELHTYGTSTFVADAGVDHPPSVSVRPSFTPADADAVFDRADVLVLPSVVRESYSLVTREALARGMCVIATDSLGPEEVVVDGHNGLIVPAGDALALAKAMTRIVREPGLRASLARGAREGVVVRDLDEQIDGLNKRFLALVDRPPAPPAIRRRTVERVLFIAGIEGAPLRYRARFAAEALELAGVKTWVRHYRSPEVAALAGMADAIVVYRVPATRQILALVAGVRDRGTPVFYDVDDLIFDPDVAATIPAVKALPMDERQLYDQGIRRYRTMLEACDAFIGPTEMLVEHVTSAVGISASRWWNGVGIGPARCSDAALTRARTPGRLRIGYMSGTNTHDYDWRHIEPAVAKVLRQRPKTELWLGGLVTPTPAIEVFADRVKRIPMLPWWELPWVLRDLDVNLAPLEPGSTFNEAKSAIKWLEAALTETVTVATPTRPFQECIVPGVNGEFATTTEEFADRILILLDDDLARKRMAKRARRDALLRWSPHLQGHRYLEILRDGTLGRHQPSSWSSDEATDEPWIDVGLEDYIVPDPDLLGGPVRDFSVDDFFTDALCSDGSSTGAGTVGGTNGASALLSAARSRWHTMAARQRASWARR